MSPRGNTLMIAGVILAAFGITEVSAATLEEIQAPPSLPSLGIGPPSTTPPLPTMETAPPSLDTPLPPMDSDAPAARMPLPAVKSAPTGADFSVTPADPPTPEATPTEDVTPE